VALGRTLYKWLVDLGPSESDLKIVTIPLRNLTVPVLTNMKLIYKVTRVSPVLNGINIIGSRYNHPNDLLTA
jgi:hypothetical protein